MTDERVQAAAERTVSLAKQDAEADRPPAEPFSGLNLHDPNDRVPRVIHLDLKWDTRPARGAQTPTPTVTGKVKR